MAVVKIGFKKIKNKRVPIKHFLNVASIWNSFMYNILLNLTKGCCKESKAFDLDWCFLEIRPTYFTQINGRWLE